MKIIIRSYALGLLTAVLAIGAVWVSEHTEKDGKPNNNTMTPEEAKELLSEHEFHVLAREEWEHYQELKDTYEPFNKTNPDEKQKANTDKEAGKPQHFLLMIEPGMTSSDVSERLLKGKIIDDQNAFNQYLIDYGYSTSIQVGEYTLTPDMTFEEIAKTITK